MAQWVFQALDGAIDNQLSLSTETVSLLITGSVVELEILKLLETV